MQLLRMAVHIFQINEREFGCCDLIREAVCLLVCQTTFSVYLGLPPMRASAKLGHSAPRERCSAAE
jgi:hypothetical protein